MTKHTINDIDIQMIIDIRVCTELMERGHNLLVQLDSEVYEDRRIYVFANSKELEQDLQMYPSTTYYA